MVRIPISQPCFQGNEERYVVEALRSTWISSSGSFLDRFEREFAQVCSSKHSLAVCNGTAALHLAMLGLNVRPGDEVIVPALTFIATANAVRYVGAEPVFVDVDPQTWCLDPQLLEQAITPRTRGIIPVHLYGNPVAMADVIRIATLHGLWIVEDAAEAHFAEYGGSPVGSLGAMGVFSFYGNKTVTCGEGGAIVLKDEAMAIRLRALRGQGMDPVRRYYHPIVGYNFRLTNLAAAILCAQLEQADEILKQRNEIFRLYREGLKCCADVTFQTIQDNSRASPWMVCILHPRRDDISRRLAANGIETRPMFIPIHSMPPYRHASNIRGVATPIADRLSRTGLCLPTYAGLASEQIEEICEIIAHG